MNVGEYDPEDDRFEDESDFESDFSFLGINFMSIGEFGEELSPMEDCQENSTQVGVTLNTHDL